MLNLILLTIAQITTASFTTEDILKLIMFLLGSGFFGWKLIEKLLDEWNKRKNKKHELLELKEKTEIEQSQLIQKTNIENEKSFQENIILERGVRKQKLRSWTRPRRFTKIPQLRK